jgi:GMP synthase (glutamine-hydrolysing)
MIVILNFGSQTCELIARRVRECHVFSEVLSYDESIAEIKKRNPKGIILSGGPASVYEPGAPMPNPEILNLGIPVLGICYGMQWFSQHLGGKVEKDTVSREFGKSQLKIKNFKSMFMGFDDQFIAWMSHGDTVTQLPTGFVSIGSTNSIENAAIANDTQKIYGLQFHPEVVHTHQGTDIIKNFVIGICKAEPNWSMKSYMDQAIAEARQVIGSKKVLLGLSGGVDSTVVAALLHKAVGKQLICMFIDQGFMRKNESERIVKMIGKYFDINLVHIDASQRFYDKVKGVTDPEQKRKIIGNEFVRVFEQESAKIGDFEFLAQGTLYPDIIESAVQVGHNQVGKAAVKIKTHHNVGGLPADMKFKIIEPLKMLFKDEVRQLGRELGVHEEVINRQPFPGPGLAIRILGEVTPERVKILQDADKIIMDEVRSAGLYTKLWQSFGVLLPIKTVGVMGDARTYQNTLAIRAVTSEDAMTANWARLPYELLEILSSRIINEVPGINRVVYDISSKPPSTIEWE